MHVPDFSGFNREKFQSIEITRKLDFTVAVILRLCSYAIINLKLGAMRAGKEVKRNGLDGDELGKRAGKVVKRRDLDGEDLGKRTGKEVMTCGLDGEDLACRQATNPAGGEVPGCLRVNRSVDRKFKRVIKTVGWADEVGGSLNAIKFLQDDSVSASGVAHPRSGDEGATAKHKSGKAFDGVSTLRQAGSSSSNPDIKYAFFPGCGSYKEAVLRKKGPQVLASTLSTKKSPSPYWPGRESGRTRGEKCSRCLASDHRARNCRDPFRCRACLGFGHRAFQCKKTIMQGGRPVNRDRRRRERPPSLKAYVPFTEEFLRRTELRRNALLADVIQPADLGHAPQQTIANALARRFGGYAHDFFVARYRERDFAILLPGWVSAEVLVRRQVVTLENFWLRCFPWGPYWNARAHRVRHTAWIQLRNLPFECWTAARVASMISGFGRFLRADGVTKEMSDLRAYRCRIAVDEIWEIPQNLSVVLGEEVFAVQVHLESWERAPAGGGDDLPAPPPNGPNDGPGNNPVQELRLRASSVATQEGADEGGAEGEVVEPERPSVTPNSRGIGGRAVVGFRPRSFDAPLDEEVPLLPSGVAQRGPFHVGGASAEERGARGRAGHTSEERGIGRRVCHPPLPAWGCGGVVSRGVARSPPPPADSSPTVSGRSGRRGHGVQPMGRGRGSAGGEDRRVSTSPLGVRSVGRGR